ncbi:MAG: hypothetical protein V3U45_07985 [bacterium]
MPHDWATLAAIGGITLLAALSILEGTGNGVLAGAFTALGTLGGVKIALAMKKAA